MFKEFIIDYLLPLYNPYPGPWSIIFIETRLFTTIPRLELSRPINIKTFEYTSSLLTHLTSI